MADRKFWNAEIELMDRQKLEALQLKKIQKEIKYVCEKSDFYRKKFQDAGARPEDIRTFDDFHKLPIMLTPKEFKEGQKESLEKYGHPFGMYLCVPLDKVAAVQATAGTTGEPSFYAWTKHDIWVNDEALARAYWRAGMRPGDTVIHGMGLSMWTGGIPMIRAISYLGAIPIPAGAEAGSERFLQLIQLTRPKFMICTPSFANYLIEKTPQILGIPVNKLGIKKVICAGEPGVGIPAFRKKVEEAWGAKFYDFAGAVWGISGISCDYPEYQGMHLLSEDFNLHYDLVDGETLKPIAIKDGAIGAAVITLYDWEAAPVIKYLNKDVMQIFTETCPCGVPGYRRKIIGRIDDLIIVKGVNVYPSAVQNVINSFVPQVTGHLRIVVKGNPPHVIPPVTLKLEHGENTGKEELSGLGSAIRKKMGDLLSFTPDIEFVEPGALTRSQLKTKLVEIKS